VPGATAPIFDPANPVTPPAHQGSPIVFAPYMPPPASRGAVSRTTPHAVQTGNQPRVLQSPNQAGRAGPAQNSPPQFRPAFVPPPDAPGAGPLKISSGLIRAPLPPLDEGGLSIIVEACEDMRDFAPDAVMILVEEIRSLRAYAGQLLEQIALAEQDIANMSPVEASENHVESRVETDPSTVNGHAVDDGPPPPPPAAVEAESPSVSA
jgi:hypothetical protein